MKKCTCIVLVMIMLFTSQTMCFADENKDKLEVIGDSIAAGYGIEDEENIYGNIIAQERDYILSNDAISGYDTTDLLKLLEEDNTVKSNIKEAETVVVSIGGNDFLHLRNDTSLVELMEIVAKGKDSSVIVNLLATVKKNLRSIHEIIRELNPDAKIVLQTVYNPFLGQSDKFAQLLCQLVELFRTDYEKIYKEEADTDSNMVIADVEKEFNDYYDETKSVGLIQDDFIHPSIKGHRMIADIVENAMDDVHKAGWSSIEKSASALIRLGNRMFQ